MKTKYFTFCQNQEHIINDIVFDKDCVVEITADNPRDVMFATFGDKWGFDYNKIPDMSYYPRGIIKLNHEQHTNQDNIPPTSHNIVAPNGE